MRFCSSNRKSNASEQTVFCDVIDEERKSSSSEAARLGVMPGRTREAALCHRPRERSADKYLQKMVLDIFVEVILRF